jgi:TetR/AcrR family transcriptional regulator
MPPGPQRMPILRQDNNLPIGRFSCQQSNASATRLGSVSTPARAEKRRPGRPSDPIDRNELLQIAGRTFADRGYVGASLSIIAEAAGIRKASLYHHFATKEVLYVSVVDGIIAELQQLVMNAQLGDSGFLERLDQLGELVVDYLGTHPEAAQLVVHELIGSGKYLEVRGRTAVQSTLDITSAFLEAGMDSGVFRRQCPKQLALSISGVHLLYFAATENTSEFLGASIFSASQVATRKATVLAHVRALCV